MLVIIDMTGENGENNSPEEEIEDEKRKEDNISKKDNWEDFLTKVPQLQIIGAL